MKSREHQITLAAKALKILKEYGLVYLAMEERTGKSITALIIAEAVPAVKRILIITKLKSMAGWEETLEKWEGKTKEYDLINYHSVKKIRKSYDMVILDEAHNYISGFPKRSELWKNVFLKTFGALLVYSSATPHAQGRQLLFNQFALCKWSPWKRFSNYYDWFKVYAKRDKEGNLPTTRINASTTVVDYSAVDEEKIAKEVDHLFVTYTRAQAGFKHEPKDVVHYIELTEKTKNIYNIIMKHKVISFTLDSTGKDYTLECDSPIKLRWALHMLEGGTLKVNDEYIDLGNHEKVDYILKTWGDTEDLAIMYQYKADKIKLDKYFKKALKLQATSYSEGVDLSHIKHLVIYSQDFSTAKHSQRRARQANQNREEEIDVHFILIKKAVSEQVYKTCSVNKKDFVDSVFERNLL